MDRPSLLMRFRFTLFAVITYPAFFFWMLFGSFYLLGPRRKLIRMMSTWGKIFIWLCRVIAGLKLEVRGTEHLSKGPMLIAAKHLSAWETIALLGFFDDPCFIMKEELQKIPLLGSYIVRSHQIPLNRKGSAADMKKMLRTAKTEVFTDEGRQVIIFPEGTRRPIDAEPVYHAGVSMLYTAMDVPCLPLAHNAGLFWPSGYKPRRSGTILVEILPPIPPGMDRAAFQTEIQTQLETASHRLIAEGRAALQQHKP